MTQTIRAPRRFRRIIDAVKARDRAYFEQHPSESQYLRPYIPGETWPVLDHGGTHVLVTRIAPGIRTKTLLILREVAP
ncbi:MAG: hypothetical protein AB7R89_11085 [Dehalococcoidia bacterium]